VGGCCCCEGRGLRWDDETELGDCGTGDVDESEEVRGANRGEEEERGPLACSSSSFSLRVRRSCSNCLERSAALKSNSSSRARGRSLLAMTAAEVVGAAEDGGGVGKMRERQREGGCSRESGGIVVVSRVQSSEFRVTIGAVAEHSRVEMPRHNPAANSAHSSACAGQRGSRRLQRKVRIATTRRRCAALV
jgi:hypothetical protein